MKTRALVISALVLLAIACNNFFHELIPSDDDRIISFSVPGQVDVEIGGNTVYVTVAPGTDLSALIPTIRLASGAVIFPVIYEYTSRAFGDVRTFGAAMELYTAGSNAERVMDLIREHKDSFTVPVLDIPIDFSYPVDCIVLSARGTTRRYTVRVEIDTGEGTFKSFGFEKFYNPEVVRAAVGVVNAAAKTVTVNVSYPVENIASYRLTPSFQTNEARVYLDGAEWNSGETLIDFLKPPASADLTNPAYASQTKTLTLKRAGFPDSVWTLTVNFSEDPDTSRAIIDFRFTKALNPLINADYMAEIVNSGNTGTITVTVYYSGARPEELKASFVSPGTVTVNGVTQISGYSTQDFSAGMQYTVTSRVGNNVRAYTVNVSLVPASDPLPQITYFAFTAGLNPRLLSNSTAMIDHAGRLIMIEAAYDGDTAPVNLIPDFSATGTVTANGVTQTSKAGSVNFSNPVSYTVSNPSNPTLKREYRVEVKFVKSLSSIAEIETFSFYVADNPDLIEDVHATVNQTTGAITATLLFDKNLPGGNRTLVPRWSAQGRVETNGVPQTSGGASRQFYTPQTYGVVSIDSGFRKDYTVTIKEVNSRIYVRQNAAGRNDGTNWQNAYRNLPGACNDTALFPESVPKELWIAAGAYKASDTGNPDDYLLMTANTSYIGGFGGSETSRNQRNVTANKVTISNDWDGREFSPSLFSARLGPFDGWGYRPTVGIISGALFFEDLEFIKRDNMNVICIYLDPLGLELNISNCSFYGIDDNKGHAIYVYNPRSFIDDPNGGYYDNCNVAINNVVMRCTPIAVTGVHSVTINGADIKRTGKVIHVGTTENVIIENATLEDTGIFIYNAGPVRISNSSMRDKGSLSFYIYNSGDVEISNVTIESSETLPAGGGIYIDSTGTSVISNTTIRNTRETSYNNQGNVFVAGLGGGIFHGGNDYNVRIINGNVSVIETGGSRPAGRLIIRDCLFENCRSTNVAYGAIFTLNTAGTNEITNTRFINCTAPLGFPDIDRSLFILTNVTFE
jgi:hypothetical protein